MLKLYVPALHQIWLSMQGQVRVQVAQLALRLLAPVPCLWILMWLVNARIWIVRQKLFQVRVFRLLSLVQTGNVWKRNLIKYCGLLTQHADVFWQNDLTVSNMFYHPSKDEMFSNVSPIKFHKTPWCMIKLNMVKQGVQRGKMFGHQTRFDRAFCTQVKGAGLWVVYQ